MPSSQQQDITQIPWFPKTDPPLAGGAQSGEWQEKDQQTLGTIAKSLFMRLLTALILSHLHGHVLQFEQALILLPNPRFALRGAFGGLACLGLWESSGCMWTRTCFTQDHTGLRDEAVGPCDKPRQLTTRWQLRYRDPEGRNHGTWFMSSRFRGQSWVQSPSTLFCPVSICLGPFKAWAGRGWKIQ